jgi:hypothetical protein
VVVHHPVVVSAEQHEVRAPGGSAGLPAANRELSRSSPVRTCNGSPSNSDHRFASPSSSSPSSMTRNAHNTGCIPGDIDDDMGQR